MRSGRKIHRRAKHPVVLRSLHALGALAFVSPSTAVSAAETPCELAPGPARTVTRIVDGETVLLDDGRQVRLAGALSPRASDAGARDGTWPPEEAARTALAALVLGQRVELAFGATRTDRYGRLLAHVFNTKGGERLWIQGEMLAGGLARAYALPGEGTCLTELLAHERLARNSRLALWQSHVYAPRRAHLTHNLARLRSTFQIVTGKVAKVSRTKSALYLNFGDDWRNDFTVRIGSHLLRSDPDWTSTLEALAGRTIEARGWLERRNGPMLSLTSRAELTILDGSGDPPAASISQAPGNLRSRASGESARQPAVVPRPRAEKRKRPELVAPGDVDL